MDAKVKIFRIFFTFDKNFDLRLLSYSILLLLIFSCKKSIISENKAETNIYYDLAYKNLDQHEQDSAYINFYRAKDFFIAQKDSLHVAKCLINMAIIEADTGDFFGSQETSLSTISYLNEKNKDYYDVISSNYNCLGIVNSNLKNYSKSLEFYRKARVFSLDSTSSLMFTNNIANSYEEQKKYKEAINIYLKISTNKILKKNPSILSKVIDNIAYIRFLQNQNYNAEPELYQALKIREKIKDFWGQNASHAHLSDYFAKKDKQKSLFHAHKMYEIATKIKSPDDKLEALQKLIVLENPENSKKYFFDYQKLSDSLQTARNKAKNQFALIRYEAEKTKADLLKSQAENTEKKSRIFKQNILVSILFASLALGNFWYKKRRKRLEQEKEILKQEKEIEVKNTQLKYSKKVHDVVANGIYQTMVEIQNRPEITKDELLDNLDSLYEKSRDISHDDFTETQRKSFNEKISEKISSYSSEKTKVLIVGNNENLWKNVSPKIQNEVFHILQELMVNMKKHSSATLVSLKFEREEKNIKIFYRDNGLGINNLEKINRSGIQNTENRIVTIGGEIKFEKNPKGGLLVNISIPI